VRGFEVPHNELAFHSIGAMLVVVELITLQPRTVGTLKWMPYSPLLAP